MTTLLIHESGMLTTIQDMGRTGSQKYGVIASGSMDTWSARIANLLVENPETEAVLEMTFLGPKIEFTENTMIAVTGGNMNPVIDGLPLPMNRPVYIRRNTVLEFGFAVEGCRTYLAIQGGFNVPDVMGSKSTYLRAQLGGHHGRALKAGDQLPLSIPKPTFFSSFAEKNLTESFWTPGWSMGKRRLPKNGETIEIRVTPGPQMDWFTPKALEEFLSKPFEITQESDRMGYRLSGNILEKSRTEDMISEAIGFGSIQVPPDGNPILLLADRQTTGGYPKIAQIIQSDLPLVAQLSPGFSITFRMVSFNEAESSIVMKEMDLEKEKVALECYRRELI